MALVLASFALGDGPRSELDRAGTLATLESVANASIGEVSTTEPADPLIGWVRGRFARAGLEPPEVTVHFHGSRAGCQDRIALFVGTRPTSQIHLCFDEDAPPLVRQRTSLHEFAHAWTHEHLVDADRRKFLERRGLEHWDEPARWDRRGAEHAAEIIAWGLLEEEKRVLKVSPNGRASLVEGFRFLTGVDPICGVG